ncbi:MAG: type I-E CRISPR-associated protein Cas7/Cse4/CasC [PVC group bacterium]|nr:type I-E CRISPR-associated protein Cas7/Cse4/CasC [PVC group bacterium]
MSNAKNECSNLRVEFHILQSFPVTCLNRDDVGAPKTAVVGGSTRARVSSQCWKRHVRLAMHEMNENMQFGTRTKLIGALIEKECSKAGATPEQAALCGEKIEQVFIKKNETKNKVSKKDDGEEDIQPPGEKSDTLLFLSPSEVKKITAAFKQENFIPEKVIKQKDVKKQAKEIAGLIGKPNYAVDGIDIALFGRMVAQAATMNVEAAASFSHAISTHKVTNEVEFFTALDDMDEEPGSAHMGSLEFNSATYYRYISLDIGQLWENLAGQNINAAVEAFVKALYVAIPEARQTTQSGASPWEYARIMVRKGQRLQVPFETTVKAKEGGIIEPSKQALNVYLDKKEKLAGSLFGKVSDFRFGEDESFSIDNLIESIKTVLQKSVETKVTL